MGEPGIWVVVVDDMEGHEGQAGRMDCRLQVQLDGNKHGENGNGN